MEVFFLKTEKREGKMMHGLNCQKIRERKRAERDEDEREASHWRSTEILKCLHQILNSATKQIVPLINGLK